MAVYTDIAAELYPESRGSVPRGVKTFTATASGIGLPRVEIERSGLRRPKATRLMYGPLPASCARFCPRRGLSW